MTIAQLRDFVELLPDWREVAAGLDAIALVAFTQGVQGRSRVGSVELCAWEPDLWWEDCDEQFAAEHADLFDRLEVERGPVGDCLEVRFTEAQARAFQLLHVLPHELGHHHDRITNKTGWRAARGEDYAERYAYRVMDAVWPAYLDRFGI